MSLDLFNLKGKTAIVTGASKGIGKGLAHALASAGANLVLVGRNEGLLREVANQINKFGIKVIFVKADVTREIKGFNEFFVMWNASETNNDAPRVTESSAIRNLRATIKLFD